MKPGPRTMLDQLPDQFCAENPAAAELITVARIGLKACEDANPEQGQVS